MCKGAKNIDILNITLFHKLIPNAPNGQNVFRCIGICFNLFTNLSYECHDVTLVKKITFLPYCIINLFFGKTSPQLEARKKDVKLFWSKRNFCPIFYNFSFLTVYFKVFCTDYIIVDKRRGRFTIQNKRICLAVISSVCEVFNSDFSFSRPVDLNSSEFRLFIRKPASSLEIVVYSTFFS